MLCGVLGLAKITKEKVLFFFSNLSDGCVTVGILKLIFLDVKNYKTCEKWLKKQQQKKLV